MKKIPAFARSVKISALAAVALGLSLMVPVETKAMEIGALRDIQPMSKAQLSKYRGGFKIGNYEIALGVDIKGWVDGVLQTSLNLTVGNLQGILANNKAFVHTNTPDGSTPDVPGNTSVEVPGTEVATTVPALNLQADTPEHLANLLAQQGILNTLITNTKDGANIEQITKMTVAIANFNEVNPAKTSGLVNMQSLLQNAGINGMIGFK